MKALAVILTFLSLVCCLFSPGSIAAEESDVPVRTNFSFLNRGNIEKNYRDRAFCAYLSNDELRRRLKTGNYSSYENPTGIFFSAGEKVLISVTGSQGQSIKLIVQDFEKDGQRTDYDLTEGDNKLTISSRGLGYIDYRSKDPQAAPPVRIKIRGGRVNGVFTRADNAATWRYLLKNAKCNIMDLIGERCQLTFDVNSLRKYCANEGPELLALYDRIIELEQNDVLGWNLDHSHPGNHIHGRVQWGGFMHADGLGAAFHVDTLSGLANVDGLTSSAWGVAHEFGHVNQTRPGMLWIGMGEVTNNICSAWVNYNLNPDDMRLEHEVIQNADNESMRGGRFDCYINNALVRNRLWQFHGGPDFDGILTPPTEHVGDHFVSVCPLWQLMLYFTVARGNTHFYPDIYHDVRVTDETKMTNGELRTLFFKRVCDAAQTDMSDFFVRLGILAPVDRGIDDYGRGWLTVTDEMCKEALAYAAKYPKPDSSVIYYITANSAPIFRDRLDVVPSRKLRPENGRIEVSSEEWKNAVAFEAYKGNTLLRVSLLGLNHEDNASTTVVCPEGTDRVCAVQWDGKRYTVFGRSPHAEAPHPSREKAVTADGGG